MHRPILMSLVLLVAEFAPVRAQEWKPITTAILKSEKPGYGGLCGVVVHPATGDLLINLSDRGFYESRDQGESWDRIGTRDIKGRTETPLCLMIDPVTRNRLVSTFVYGSSIVVSEGDEGNWKVMSDRAQHVDWCAVDWTDPNLNFVLTLKHESGDLLLVSRDGGETFAEIGKGYGPAWIFDPQTAVVAEAKSAANPQPGIVRTTDGAKTLERCHDAHAMALPRFHSGELFWLTAKSLIHTADQGKSWQVRSDVKDGICGPVFGDDSKHLLILTKRGILESDDGGVTWMPPILLPADMQGASSLSWIAYDPLHDFLYVMKMGSELYQWKRRQRTIRGN